MGIPQHWSAYCVQTKLEAVKPSLILGLILLQLEPVYDNMGPRTTADGSSVLSLNKAGLDSTPARPPSSASSVATRPAVPQQPSPLPAFYSPIEELESLALTPPRVNGHHHHHTLAGHHRQSTASPSPGSNRFASPADRSASGRRGSWSRISPESSLTGSLTLGRQPLGSRGMASQAAGNCREDDRESLLLPGTVKRPTSIASITSANSTTPLTNGSGAVRTVKVPPKPPPKPKKKVGPLFEDEGEDGTEV